MTYYAPWLVTLDYVRTHRGLLAAVTDIDVLIRQFIAESSAEFIEALERIPMPYVDTKRFGADQVRGLSLKLHEDLLDVTTLTNGSAAVLTSDLYNLRPDNLYPKHTVELLSNGGTYWNLPYREDRVSLAGVWGYVPHYAQTAFRSTSAVIPAGDLASGATSMVLAAGKGALFEVGQYLACTTAGVRELMQITAITTDTLTLARAELGTSAALHSAGDVLQIVSPLADIQMAVREMVVYKVLHKDQIGSRVTVIANGIITVEDLSPSVEKTIRRHKRQHLPLAV